MSSPLEHLEILADVDGLLAETSRWAEGAPDWPAARACQAVVRRLAQRAESLRVRLEAPLVVALLGGTGTGKSALVNALVGHEVAATGRQRPTTMRPALIARPDVTPGDLGIDAALVEHVAVESPGLRDIVLLDCPDSDTTEEEVSASGEQLEGPTPPSPPLQGGASAASNSNLARLRRVLPYCDVILVVTTQQKYRSARVAAELLQAARGARLVFVQTHASTDEDIRDDWRRVLQAASDIDAGGMYFVDSLEALADAQAGRSPRGEFGRLVDLLDRELSGAARARIRRANFLDLIDGALELGRQRIDAGMPPVEALEAALSEQRGRLAARLAGQMRDELLTSRRTWENRLLGEVVARYGLSPFSLVLRAWQALGSLVTGVFLARARSPAQMALWGAMEGRRVLRRRSQERGAEATAERAAARLWQESDLRTAAIIVEGYAGEAGLDSSETRPESLRDAGDRLGEAFVSDAAAELDGVLKRLAGRHSGWFPRVFYELAVLAMAGLLLYRLGKNFFYDSWLAPLFGPVRPVELLGTEFLIQAAFWMLLWCLLLIWTFTLWLRRGLRREVDSLAARWAGSAPAEGLFARLESDCRAVRRFRQDWDRLSADAAAIRKRLAEPAGELGHLVHPRRVAESRP